MKFVLILILLGATNTIAQKDVSISFDLNPTDSLAEELEIDVFKFYISSVSLQFEDGSSYQESNSYHLINKADSNSQLILLNSVPNKPIAQISFTLGTDSLANVSGAIGGDLDPILGMYWAWNSGYINFKLEGKKGAQTFEFHIGGYNGVEATAKTFSYSTDADQEIKINIDPLAFLNQIDLTTTHSLMIPGAEAVLLTDNYQNMISIE
ncbi:MAG: hypothetical protein ACJA0U_003194 [Salibacteraceae bacterium]|jgi:hypothetical protein